MPTIRLARRRCLLAVLGGGILVISAARRHQAAVERSPRRPADVGSCPRQAGAYDGRLESHAAEITARTAPSLASPAEGLRAYYKRLEAKQEMHASSIAEREPIGCGTSLPSLLKQGPF